MMSIFLLPTCMSGPRDGDKLPEAEMDFEESVVAFRFLGSRINGWMRNPLPTMYVWVARDTDLLPLSEAEWEEPT